MIETNDPRLMGRGYGRKLLASLPPMRRTRDLVEARRFLQALVAGVSEPAGTRTLA